MKARVCMACATCNGFRSIFNINQNGSNVSAHISKDGKMTIRGTKETIVFQIERCPVCGQLLTQRFYADLKEEDDIWYANTVKGIVEHAVIDKIITENNQVKEFSVIFDDERYETFDGKEMGTHFFLDESTAEEIVTWN